VTPSPVGRANIKRLPSCECGSSGKGLRDWPTRARKDSERQRLTQRQEMGLHLINNSRGAELPINRPQQLRLAQHRVNQRTADAVS
jgi:hypothetical protein